MSDDERLLAAAQAVEGIWDDAIVALMRAVGRGDVDAPHTVVGDDGAYDTAYCAGCGDIWPCWPSTVHDAARVLARTILGGCDD